MRTLLQPAQKNMYEILVGNGGYKWVWAGAGARMGGREGGREGGRDPTFGNTEQNMCWLVAWLLTASVLFFFFFFFFSSFSGPSLSAGSSSRWWRRPGWRTCWNRKGTSRCSPPAIRPLGAWARQTSPSSRVRWNRDASYRRARCFIWWCSNDSAPKHISDWDQEIRRGSGFLLLMNLVIVRTGNGFWWMYCMSCFYFC